MEWLGVSLALIFVIPLAHHLGFIDKAYEVLGKIAECPMCCTFWASWPILWLFCKLPLVQAILLSFILAYLVNYVNLILSLFDKLYDWLWDKINQR